MNFQQLEYAIAVYEHGHFGHAADSVNITQATLSAMLKKLEKELGYVLFDRSRHPIQTTEEGIQFIELAKEVLSRRSEMYELGSLEAGPLMGKLTLGIIPTIANALLPEILPSLVNAHPELELSIQEITTEEIIQKLKTDQLDLGILATPLDEEFIREEALYYEAMMVYGILDRRKSYVSNEDIRSGKIWLLEEGHCFRNQSMTICDIVENEQTAGNLNFEGGSFETLMQLSDRFGGYTLVPELYTRNLSEEQRAKIKSFKAPIPVREVSLVSSRPHAKTRASAYLIQLIQEKIPPFLRTSGYANKDLEIIGI